jgi:peroxiredoxin
MYDDFRTAGVELIALSVDEPARANAMRTEMGLEFEILCDTGREVITPYGLLNSREKGGIAFPAVMIIDRDRTVRFLAREDVANRVEPADVLKLVTAFNKGLKPTAEPRPRGVWPGAMFIRATMNALRHGVNVRWRS